MDNNRYSSWDGVAVALAIANASHAQSMPRTVSIDTTGVAHDILRFLRFAKGPRKVLYYWCQWMAWWPGWVGRAE